MKTLVTGAAGFLGGCVATMAAERGLDVRALVRRTSGVSALAHLPARSIYYGDMTDRASLAEAADGVEAVVHCAAATPDRPSDLEASRAVNVIGTRDLIEAAAASGLRPRWVQISSMSAHRNSSSPYGVTKLEAESVVCSSTLPWTILRPSVIYGPGEKGLVAKTVRLIRRLPVMPIVGPGTQLLRPVYVADVGGAALDCLERMGTIGKTYMIGGRDEVTFDEFMRRLAVAAGVKRPRVHIPILLAMGIARTLAAVMKNPPLTVDNVLGVMQARRVDIAPAVEDFQFGPMGLEEGLKLTFAPK